jgi:GntR family transcriptional regulator
MLIEPRKSVTSQVTAILSERIRTQEYLPGSRLPSESDLAREFRVSRASIRSALGKLASEGLVIRKQGDGPYVNARLEHIATRMGAMWNFTRLIENSGYAPRIQLLAQEIRPTTVEEAKVLDLTEAESALSLTRLFYADDIPVIFTHTIVPVHVLQVPPQQCDGALPLGEFIQRYHNTPISYTIFDIQAALADDAASRMLHIVEGAPLLKLDQIFYDKMNHPIVFSEAFFQDKLIRLRLAQSWD